MSRTLMVACGALVRELRTVVSGLEVAPALDIAYLPAPLHNRPERIVDAIDALLAERLLTGHEVDRVLIGYADCGTGGLLDPACERWATRYGVSVDRLPGDHCYEFFTGADPFRRLHAQELGTFFLTDFIARHFDTLIWQAFDFDDHPELVPMMFGNYCRLTYLQQLDDPALVEQARAAAERLGLDFVLHHTGLAPLRDTVVELLPSTAEHR